MEIQGKVAIVSGGASGLGLACVRQCVQAGAKVVILDFDGTKGEAVAAEIGNNVVFCKTDVTSEKDVKSAVNTAVEKFGELSIVINCAGVANPAKVLGKTGPFSLESFNQVIQINLIGTMNVIRLAVDQMVNNPASNDGEKGVIINTASIAAFEGQTGQAAYASSKAGIVGLTLPLAREFAGYGIRVAAIAPGLFETPMLAGLPEKAKTTLVDMVNFPKRFGKPEEFASLAAHIVTNTYLNGVTIRLDSGMTMTS